MRQPVANYKAEALLLMKLIRILKVKFRRFFKYRLSSGKTDLEEDKAFTIKRSRLNRSARSFSRTQSNRGGPCSTKRFKRCGTINYCQWVFTVIEGNDQGRQFIAATPELKIGRQPENHICLSDPRVSRFHALIKVKDSHLIIKDLQSTNGTLVNNVRIRRHKLQPGDLIKLGETIIQVKLEKN